jgi:arabinofuranosyltransferase
MRGPARATATAAVIASGFGALLAAFWKFTADDAYITARYARNLADDGEWVYNSGERVSAMTSPLHGILLGACEFVFGSSITPNKVLGAMAVLVAALIGAAALRRDRTDAWIFLAAVLLSPFTALWAVGGLETPYLLLLVTLIVVLTADPRSLGPRRTAVVAVLVGLAFITRHDSIVFTAPLLLWLAWRHRRSPRGLAALGGASIALAWLAFAKVYFGDFLPTTFYVKQPGLQEGFRDPAIYAVQFLILSGVVLLALPAVWQLRHPERRRAVAVWAGSQRGWLIVGLTLVLAYGVLAGMKHMMFSYRIFVPYLPAFVLLSLELARRTGAGPSVPRFAALLPVLQIGVALWIVFRGLNPSLVGEVRHESLRAYTRDLLPTLSRGADDIRSDWKRRGIKRPPRVLTFTGGVLPYELPDAYVYEQLVSYRHHCYYYPSRTTDYAHIPPELVKGPVWSDPDLRRRMHLVSERSMEFDRIRLRFNVYFIERPEPNRLPNTIDGRCL